MKRKKNRGGGILARISKQFDLFMMIIGALVKPHRINWP